MNHILLVLQRGDKFVPVAEFLAEPTDHFRFINLSQHPPFEPLDTDCTCTWCQRHEVCPSAWLGANVLGNCVADSQQKEPPIAPDQAKKKAEAAVCESTKKSTVPPPAFGTKSTTSTFAL